MNYDRDALNQGGRNLSITPGMNVYDANGDKVGSVQEYSPQANLMVVEKGFIFTRDLFIPISAISRSSADELYLNLTKDDLKDERFAFPPTSTEEYTSGMVNRTDVAERGSQLGAPQGKVSEDRDINVPVVEEELSVDKQRRETGRVQVHTNTVEEQQSVNIPVTREHVEVERVPVDKELPVDQINVQNMQNRDIVMPVMGEEVVAEKRPVVKEEIRIHKEPVTETERVSDTVRKERVNIEGLDEQGNPVDKRANPNTDINP